MDAGNMLKPMLARGELRVVGATTLDEYRKYIEKDAGAGAAIPAGVRRRADGREHDRDSARPQGALRGAPRRAHHGRRDRRRGDAVQSLHRRPVPAGQGDRPDRRGGVAGSGSRSIRCPQEIDEVERRIMQLEIEREALRKEKDAASEERREALERELTELRERSSGMKAQWQQEKETLGAVGKLKQQIDEARGPGGAGDAGGRPGQARRRSSTGAIPQLEQEHARRRGAARVAQTTAGRSSCNEEVDGGRRRGRGGASGRGFPVTRMLEGERERLTQARRGAGARVIGQREAVHAVANAVRRVAGRVCRTRTGRSGRSSSWARRAWGRRRRRARWRSFCSTTSRRWCGSTCPSTWRSTPSRG